MKAVILAGGEGTRLRPLTSNQPKPMMPIANVPMMEHVVKLLARHGFRVVRCRSTPNPVEWRNGRATSLSTFRICMANLRADSARGPSLPARPGDWILHGLRK